MAFDREVVEDFTAYGIRAFTTGRRDGSFATAGTEPVGDVMGRWAALRSELAPSRRLATAGQIHGRRVIVHGTGWEGWLRAGGADGHCAPEPGTALAVTVADCVPIFLAHPSGAAALLHSGWRGTAAFILDEGVRVLGENGCPARELLVHLGPAICGRCYEVSPDVHARLTGRTVDRPAVVDLRALIADRARVLGVRQITVSSLCTRCDNDRYFSHRAGDAGRQLGVMVASG